MRGIPVTPLLWPPFGQSASCLIKTPGGNALFSGPLPVCWSASGRREPFPATSSSSWVYSHKSFKTLFSTFAVFVRAAKAAHTTIIRSHPIHLAVLLYKWKPLGIADPCCSDTIMSRVHYYSRYFQMIIYCNMVKVKVVFFFGCLYMFSYHCVISKRWLKCLKHTKLSTVV